MRFVATVIIDTEHGESSFDVKKTLEAMLQRFDMEPDLKIVSVSVSNGLLNGVAR